MFWYLSIIQQPPYPNNSTSTNSNSNNSNANKSLQQEKQTELPKNPKKNKEAAGNKKNNRRKQDSIQKRNPSGQHPNHQRRVSETAYPAPQYEMQAQQYRNPPPQPPPHQQPYSPLSSSRNVQQGQQHQQLGSAQIYPNQDSRHSAFHPQHGNHQYVSPRPQNGFRDENDSGDDSANDSEPDPDRSYSYLPDIGGSFSDDERLERLMFKPRVMEGYNGLETSTNGAFRPEMGRDTFGLAAGNDGFLQSAKTNLRGEFSNSAQASLENGSLVNGGVLEANRRRSQSSGPHYEERKSPSSAPDRQRARSPIISNGRVVYNGSHGTVEDDEDNIPLALYKG